MNRKTKTIFLWNGMWRIILDDHWCQIICDLSFCKTINCYRDFSSQAEDGCFPTIFSLSQSIVIKHWIKMSNVQFCQQKYQVLLHTSCLSMLIDPNLWILQLVWRVVFEVSFHKPGIKHFWLTSKLCVNWNTSPWRVWIRVVLEWLHECRKILWEC